MERRWKRRTSGECSVAHEKRNGRVRAVADVTCSVLCIQKHGRGKILTWKRAVAEEIREQPGLEQETE